MKIGDLVTCINSSVEIGLFSSYLNLNKIYRINSVIFDNKMTFIKIDGIDNHMFNSIRFKLLNEKELRKIEGFSKELGKMIEEV